MTTLIKRSPLSGVFRKSKAAMAQVSGWEVAEHFGDTQGEQKALEEGCVVVDWSHIGKISVRGRGAEARVAALWEGVKGLPPLQAHAEDSFSILRVVRDEFLLLCACGAEGSLLAQLHEEEAAVANETGGWGALTLAGPRRHEILERSAAMDLMPLKPGDVVQTTMHFIPCTFYRAENWDLLLQTRDYTRSLFDALMDMNESVGIVASGVTTVPVEFGNRKGEGARDAVGMEQIGAGKGK